MQLQKWLGVIACIGMHTIDNAELIKVNSAIRNHPIEATGKVLREAMTAMKAIKQEPQSEEAIYS